MPNATGARTESLDLSAASAALWLAATAFLALLAIYFVGVDQGAVQVEHDDGAVQRGGIGCGGQGVVSGVKPSRFRLNPASVQCPSRLRPPGAL